MFCKRNKNKKIEENVKDNSVQNKENNKDWLKKYFEESKIEAEKLANFISGNLSFSEATSQIEIHNNKAQTLLYSFYGYPEPPFFLHCDYFEKGLFLSYYNYKFTWCMWHNDSVFYLNEITKDDMIILTNYDKENQKFRIGGIIGLKPFLEKYETKEKENNT